MSKSSNNSCLPWGSLGVGNKVNGPMCVRVFLREGRGIRYWFLAEGGEANSTYLCVIYHGPGSRATLFDMACLLTLFITIPSVWRATIGYNHLASVNTSYTVELRTSK